MGAMYGQYDQLNVSEQVQISVWRLDTEESTIENYSTDSIAGQSSDEYKIFRCAMYRWLDDDYSSVQLEIGDEINWLFGFRFYNSVED